MKITTSNSRTLSRLQLLSRLLSGNAGDTVDRLLSDLAKVFNLAEVGCRWPIPGQPKVFARVGQSRSNHDDESIWTGDVVGRLAGALTCEEAFFHPNDPQSLLVPLIVDERRNGVLWIVSLHPLGDEEQQFLALWARCVVLHPAFIEKMDCLNEQSRIAQRLQDASAVSGKIAHDFDNIFTGVVGFAEMVQDMLEPGSLARQYVGEIMAAGNRGIAFTQQLHQMSRSGVARPIPTSIHGVLQREEARLKKNPGPNVKLQFTAANNLPPVAMDSAALQQVIGNLLENAVEASPPGGSVRVSAALIELSEMEAREYFGAVAAGPFVELRIADDGPGVRDDHRKKLFVEPFFTTKVRHRGLGLPVALRILNAHRGGVRHMADPIRGSVFHVVVPLAAARLAETGITSVDITRTPGGNAS